MSTSIRHPVMVRLLAALVLGGALMAPSASARAIGVHSRPAIKSGGTLTLGTASPSTWTQGWNPYAPSLNTGTGFIYEPLFYFNQQKGGKITPWLATSYKWSNHNSVLTFRLRSGVKWSDGKPFTAQDVVFTYDLTKTYPGFGLCGFCWSNIDSVSAPNATTVVWRLKTVDTTDLYQIGSSIPLPQHVWKDVGDPTRYQDANPVATGPFKLGSFSPTVFTLVKNTRYWQMGKPYVSALRFPVYSSADALTLALIKGEVTWGADGIPNYKQVYTSKSPNNHVWADPTALPFSLWLNNATAPFNNAHVRRAISFAVDRTAIYKVGNARAYPPANAILMQPQYIKRWADPKLLTSTAPVKPDVKQARAELKKATGASMSKPMKLLVPAGSANELADAQLIASELGAIGMNVQVQTPSLAEFNNDLGLGNYDMAIQYTTGTGDSPFWMYYLAFSDLLYKPVGQYSYTNWARYQNGTLNSLLASYKHAAKLANQVAIMKKAEAIIARDVPVVPLFNSDWWEEYNTSQFTGFPSKQDPYDLGSPFVGNLNANLNAALRIHLK